MKNLHDRLEQASQEEEEDLLRSALRKQFDQDLRKKLASKLQETYGVHRSEDTKNRSRRIGMRRFLAIAASLALLVSVFLWLLPSQGSRLQLAREFLEQGQLVHPGLTKGVQEVEQVRLEAIKSFNEHDYEKASSFFSSITNKTVEDEFYLGVSLLHTKDYEGATNTLAPLLDKPSNLEQELNWYLGLSYILKGDTELAENYLQKIDPGQWKYEEASQLLAGSNVK